MKKYCSKCNVSYDEDVQGHLCPAESPLLLYQPEIWAVPKDTIYAAATAIELALGYMPLIKTDVPQWAKTVELDVVIMKAALAELRKLDCFLESGLQSKD